MPRPTCTSAAACPSRESMTQPSPPSCREAALVFPDNPEYQLGLGCALHGAGQARRRDRRRPSRDRIKRDDATAHANLGAALHAQGKVQEARPGARSSHRSCARKRGDSFCRCVHTWRLPATSRKDLVRSRRGRCGSIPRMPMRSSASATPWHRRASSCEQSLPTARLVRLRPGESQGARIPGRAGPRGIRASVRRASALAREAVRLDLD